MFRFTIRDVLWLTVVVAIGCAWWIERRELSKAVEWRYRAGALESYLTDDGKEVSYRATVAIIYDKRKLRETSISGKAHPPSEK